MHWIITVVTASIVCLSVFSTEAWAQNALDVAKDYVQARALLRKAAVQGVAASQVKLGSIYLNGLGVERDEAEAALWFRKAAEQGDVDGQLNLGNLYQYGRGVPKDGVQALFWYRKAAELGNATAQFAIGVICDTGNGVAPDPVEAMLWYRKAADQKYPDAEFNMAAHYYNGQGVPEDKEKANEWLQRAANDGSQDAKAKLAELNANSRNLSADYRAMSFEDFKLDGKDLALHNAKVRVVGFYKKLFGVETLNITPWSVAASQRSGQDNGIPLLTEDAPRELRKLFLECGDNILRPLGCPFNIDAHVDICTSGNALASTKVPCLVVENGTLIPRWDPNIIRH